MNIIEVFRQNHTDYHIAIRGTYEDPLFRASDIADTLGIINIRCTIADFPDSEKCYVNMDTPGGIQSVLFLTESGVNHILFVSKKPLAADFRKWVFDVLKTIRLKGVYDLKKEKQLRLDAEKALKEVQTALLKQQHDQEIIKIAKEKLEKENEMLRIMEKKPVIYIYNTNNRRYPTGYFILKVGVSGTHGRTAGRTAQFKAVVAGELLYFKELPINCDAPLKAEMFIHHLLQRYNYGGKEQFEVSYEYAEAVVHAVVGLVHASYALEEAHRFAALKNISDSVNKHVFGISTENGRHSIEISTDVVLPVVPQDQVQKEEEDNNLTIFDKFIQEKCILSDELETPTKVLEGELRLYLGEATKETYHKMLKYLGKKFQNIRVPMEGADHVVYGYRGLGMKETYSYKLPTDVKDYNLFLLAECRFSPEAKIHRSYLQERYKRWKQASNHKLLDGEFEEFIRYLDKHPRVLKDCVYVDKPAWGFYGLCMLDDPVYIKKTSSTAKSVEKRTIDHILLKRYPTIAKAAEDNKLPATKLSRLLKENKASFDEYYFTIVGK